MHEKRREAFADVCVCVYVCVCVLCVRQRKKTIVKFLFFDLRKQDIKK